MERFKPSLHCSSAYARFTREWDGNAPFVYQEQPCYFRLGDLQSFHRGLVLRALWKQLPVQWYLPEQGLCECLDATLQGIDLQQCGDALRPLLLQTLQEAIVAIFSQQGIVLEDPTVDATTRPIENAIAFDWMNGDAAFYRWYVSEADAHTLQLMVQFNHKEEDVGDFQALIFPFRKIIGQTHLTWEELRTLRIGDILLNQWPNGLTQFCWHHVFFYADQQATNYFVKTFIMEDVNEDLPVGIIPDANEPVEEIDGETEEATTTPVATPKFPLEQLPVRITFDAGQKQLTFEQLQHLHEGYTFELENKVDDAVQILANGVIIGQGEWVQIQDRLGVRITHLNHPSKHDA